MGGPTALIRQVLRLAYMLGLDESRHTQTLRLASRRVARAESAFAYVQLHAGLDLLIDEILDIIDGWPVDHAVPIIELCDEAEAAAVRAHRSHLRGRDS